MMPNNQWVRIAGLFGFTGVALGAFAAHILKTKLTPDLFNVFQVGIRYHLFHSLVLLALGLMARQPEINLRWPGLFFSYGIFLFSGSLYLMALTGIKPLGMITPIGGVLFLCGWTWIIIRFKK